MNHRLPVLILAFAAALPCGLAQQPRGIHEAIDNLADQPASRVSFSYDRSQVQSAAENYLYDSDPGARRSAALYSITVDTYHFPQPAFYTPEVMTQIVNTYHAAGWQHLVEAGVTTARNARPQGPITDMWLHFRGAEIDDIAVLIRAPREMNIVQISCMLRPLDLLHLSGHFGIPRVDPNAVMVPAPNGK